MADQRILYTVDLDIKGTETLDELKKKLDQLAKTSTSMAKDAAKAVTTLNNQYEESIQRLVKVKIEQEQLAKAIKRNYEERSKDHATAQQNISDYTNLLRQRREEEKKLTESINQQASAYKRVVVSANEASNSTQSASKSAIDTIKQQNEELKKLEKQIKADQKAIKELHQEWIKGKITEEEARKQMEAHAASVVKLREETRKLKDENQKSVTAYKNLTASINGLSSSGKSATLSTTQLNTAQKKVFDSSMATVAIKNQLVNAQQRLNSNQNISTGLLSTLIAREKELRQARQDATTADQIRAINKELQETINKRKELEGLADTQKKSSAILSELIAKEKELKKAREDATSREQIRAINKELEKTVKLREKLENLGTSQPSPFANLVKSATLFALVISAVNASLNALRKGIDLGLEVEKIQTSFRVLTGSLKEAEKLLKSITEYAALTPFSFPEVAKTAKSLLAYGVENEKVMGTLKRLGDIAAISGNELSQLALIFGQVKAAGRLTTQEMNQFSQAGVPILEALREETGLTNIEIRKLAEKGLISFSVLENALVRLTDPAGRFFLGTAEQAKTLGGRLAQLGDEIKLRFLEAFDKLAPTFIKITQTATALVKQMEGFSNVVFNLPLILSQLTPYIVGIGGALLGLNLPLVIANFTALAISLRTNVVLAFASARTAVIAFNTSLRTTTGLIGLLIAALSLLAASVADAITYITNLNQKIDTQAQLIERVNEEMGKEIQKSRELWDVLKSETATREDKNAALRTLIQMYPSLLSHQLNEVSTLKQIADAQRAVNNEKMNEIRINQMKVSTDDYLKEVNEILANTEERFKGEKERKKLSQRYDSRTQIPTVPFQELNQLKNTIKEHTELNKQISTLSALSKRTAEQEKQLNEARIGVVKARENFDKIKKSPSFTGVDAREPFKRLSPTIARWLGAREYEVMPIEQVIKQIALMETIDWQQGVINLSENASAGLGEAKAKAAKEINFHREAVEADTKAIEEMILSLQRHQKAIQQEAAIFRAENDKTGTQTLTELLKLQKQADETKQQVADSVADSRRKLADDVKQTSKILTTALEDKRITQQRFNAEMKLLAAEAATAEKVINEVSRIAYLESDKKILNERIRAFEEFTYNMEEKTRQHKENIKNMEVDGFRFIMDNMLGNFDARKRSVYAAYERETEIIRQASKYRQTRIAEINQAITVAQMKFHAASDDLSREAFQKEIEAGEAEKEEVLEQERLGNQRLLAATRTFINQKQKLEQQEHQAKLEREEEQRNKYLQGIMNANDVMSGSITAGSSKLMGAITELMSHQEAANLKRTKEIKKEMELVDGLIKKYQELGEEMSDSDREVADAAQKRKAELMEEQKLLNEENLRQKIDKFINLAHGMGAVVMENLKGINELDQKLTDRLVASQQKKVDKIQQLMEKDLANRKGATAEQLQLEEERMEKLKMQKRREVEEARQLALIEISFNAAVAIAKAAATGGKMAPITIIATIAALASGFASARRQAAGAVGFKKGGFTGDGGVDQVAGVVHKGEYVFDAKTTKKYKSELDEIHKGKLDLATVSRFHKLVQNSNSMKIRDVDSVLLINSDTGNKELLQEVKNLNQLIRNQKQEVVIEAEGVYYAMAKVENKITRSSDIGRY
jgi:tape measure domain-containing protein